MIKSIEISEEDRQRWVSPLTQYYRDKGKTETEIPKIIEDLFLQVSIGWNRAPADLDTRIKMKSGFQWRSHENLIPNKIKQEKSQKEEERPEFTSDLTSSMSESEQKWYNERLEIYKKDFDFNLSSDKPLLEQLLIEELIQRRLFEKKLKYPDRNYDQQLNFSLKRVSDIQVKLGITREQRAGIMNNIDGNVAQISVELEKKLTEMPEKLKKEYEDELYYLNLRKQQSPVNILPSMDKIEALLKVGEGSSTNIDSDKIVALTEEIAKEISQIREDKENLVNEELPTGIDLSR